MKAEKSTAKENKGGRPRKFAEPSRPITITLPEKTLRSLERIDTDRGRAIVKVTERALSQDGKPTPPVEVIQVGEHVGLVVVGPTQVLRRISFLRLVEVAPSRFLLALEPGNDFKSLELAISDLLDEGPQIEPQERQLMSDLVNHIKGLRRLGRVSLANILLVRLDQTTTRH